jgi:hypothetical protein
MKQFCSFRQSNRGESLVLVTIFSTIVIGIVVTLTVISAMLLSNAGKQKSQDQAYELATSLSAEIEKLILNESEGGKSSQINLDFYIESPQDGIIVKDSGFDGIPDSTVLATVEKITDSNSGDYYQLTVTATAARETYIKTTQYSGSALMGYSRR